MICQAYPIPHFEDATLTAICEDVTEDIKAKQPRRRAVIVCPGGAYHGLAAHEGDPIAFRFLAAGFAAFVLRYSTKERAAAFRPLCELALAIRFLREHADDFHLDPDYIFTCGFSAGGHLAGSAGVLWDIPEVQQYMAGAPREICRPTGMILCYPVITSHDQFGHKGSFKRLCGTDAFDPEKAAHFSLEKHVTSSTSPAFLWHTFADNGVHVNNSLMMANALATAGVPFEAHVFPTGGHGLGLCDGAYGDPNPHNACWIDLAITWAKGLSIN
ncbi:MAG: alpha/beta hydrolase [Clostridia bacterium]|nr:alpha/beta hydrolase [Clostridia bacterium]